MKRLLVLNFIVLIILCHSGCTKDKFQGPFAAKLSLNELYQAAVSDAIIADSSEICDTLWSINAVNSKLKWKIINNEEYVLVGNFNKFPGTYSKPSLTNSWGIIWVFIPEQYKSRMWRLSFRIFMIHILQTRPIIHGQGSAIPMIGQNPLQRSD